MTKISTIEDFNFDLNILLDEYNTLCQNYPSETCPSGKKLFLVRFKKRNTTASNMVPYTESVLHRIRRFFDFDCVTYRTIKPHGSYSWHIDKYLSDHCYHIPLITNDLCEFVYDTGEKYKMPVDRLYRAKTDELHNFFNNGSTDRVHITIEKQIT